MAVVSKPDIDQLIAFAQDAILSCGQLASRFFRSVKPHERFDESLVTAAELELTAHFRQALAETFPAHRILGAEENEEGYTHEQKRYLWIFDPRRTKRATPTNRSATSGSSTPSTGWTISRQGFPSGPCPFP